MSEAKPRKLMKETVPGIKILDTTLRDGEQTQGVSFSPEEKTNIAKALLELVRVDRIEVASARVSAGEIEAVSNIIGWAVGEGLAERVEVLGFVDHGKSVDWIVEAGGRVINLLAKGSEKHCTHQLGKTLDEHVLDVRENIEIARERAWPSISTWRTGQTGTRTTGTMSIAMVEKLADAGVGISCSRTPWA